MKQIANELTHQYRVTYARPDTLIPPEQVTIAAAKPGLTVRGAPMKVQRERLNDFRPSDDRAIPDRCRRRHLAASSRCCRSGRSRQRDRRTPRTVRDRVEGPRRNRPPRRNVRRRHSEPASNWCR